MYKHRYGQSGKMKSSQKLLKHMHNLQGYENIRLSFWVFFAPKPKLLLVWLAVFTKTVLDGKIILNFSSTGLT